MHVVLIHNPGAGDGEHGRESLVRLIRRAGHTVEDFSSKDDRWHRALAGPVDLVAAAGGDGTVAEVARAVAGGPLPIAVLPFGTANNVATALLQEGMPVEELVAGWADAYRQPFDVGVARGSWGTFRFLESVGAGLLAEAMAEIEEGGAGYVNELEDADERIAAALDLFGRLLPRAPARSFTISLDGRDLSGEYVLVEALNFGVAGPNLRLAPQAGASDGLLDLVLVDQRTRRDLLDQLPVPGADPSRRPDLPVFRGRHIRLRCGDARLHLDDELRSDVDHGDVDLTVEPGALTFLVPSAGSADR